MQNECANKCLIPYRVVDSIARFVNMRNSSSIIRCLSNCSSFYDFECANECLIPYRGMDSIARFVSMPNSSSIIRYFSNLISL